MSRFSNFLKVFDVVEGDNFKTIWTSLPFVFLLVALSFIHIANNMISENYIRKIATTEKELKEMRWKYMTQASSLMKISKQSEVVKLVADQGLKELRIPPMVVSSSEKNKK